MKEPGRRPLERSHGKVKESGANFFLTLVRAFLTPPQGVVLTLISNVLMYAGGKLSGECQVV